MALKKLLNFLMCFYILIFPVIPHDLKIKNVPLAGGDLLLGIILCLYFLLIIFSRDSRFRFFVGIKDFFTDLLSIFFLILLLIMFISITYAVDKSIALSEGIRFLSYILMFFVIKYELNDLSTIRGIANSWMTSAGLLSFFGIYQYFSGYGLESKFNTILDFGARARIAVTMENPNTYSAYLILIIFSVIILFLTERTNKKKILLGGLAILLLINLVMTGSRNGLIGLAIGSVVLIFIYKYKFIYGILSGGVVALLIPQVRLRILQIGDMSQNSSRLKLWNTAWYMIKDHPIRGVGNGNFVSRYDEYVNNYPELLYSPDWHNFPSHNSYLKVQSELGILGITAFLGILVLSFSKVSELIRTINDLQLKSFFIGFLASIAAFYVMNWSDNLFFVPKATIYFWLGLAMSQGLLYRSRTVFRD